MLTVQEFYDRQVTGEVKYYSADMGEFLSSGASIASSGVAAAYTQTFNGSASGSCAVSVTGGSIVNFTSPAMASTGTYTFTVTASPSDGQVRKAIWYISIPQ